MESINPDKQAVPEPEVGQVYEDSRGNDRAQILYCDEQVVFLREETEREDGTNHHWPISRNVFHANSKSNRFKLKPDSDLDLIGAEAFADWTEVPHVGKKNGENLHDAGYDTVADVATADVDELTDVPGIGKVAAENLISFSQ